MGMLDGLRVVDLSRILAGPFAAMMLGDLGADVIKVEQPGTGDDTRTMGPPWYGDDSAYFMGMNRNKRSITVDLSTEDGRTIVLDLARTADVVIENFIDGGSRSSRSTCTGRTTGLPTACTRCRSARRTRSSRRTRRSR